MDSPLPDGTIIENAALITDTQDITDTDEITTVVESSHTLASPRPPRPIRCEAGALLTYTLAYTVTGNETALGVTLSDTVPGDTTFHDLLTAVTATVRRPSSPGTWAIKRRAPPAPSPSPSTWIARCPMARSSRTRPSSPTPRISPTPTTITTVVESSHTLALAKTARPIRCKRARA